MIPSGRARAQACSLQALISFDKALVLAETLQGWILQADLIDQKDSRPVAVKVTKASCRSANVSWTGQAVIESIDSEIQVLEELEENPHENLLSMLGCFQDEEGNMNVIYELAICDLHSFICENGSTSENFARHFMGQILSGLVHLHSLGIMHLDLSLENILLFEDSTLLKICDFGLSQRVESDSFLEEELCQWQRGKFLYMAPEIAINYRKPSILADSFSAGVVLFMMLFAKPPYTFPSIEDKFYLSITYGDIPQLLEDHGCQNQLSESAQEFLSWMLCPERRRKTAKELLDHPWMGDSSRNCY